MTWVCATAGFQDDTAFIQAAAAAVTNCAGSLRGQVSCPAAPSMHVPLHPFAQEVGLHVSGGQVDRAFWALIEELPEATTGLSTDQLMFVAPMTVL